MEATETVVAESSPAVEVPAVEQAPAQNPLELGPMVNWTRPERDKFRMTGKMPETPKPEVKPVFEARATSDPAKEPNSETPGATESPTKKQESTERKPSRKESTEERFKLLTEHNRSLKAELDALKAAKASSEPEPKPKAAEAPQPQYTRPKPTPEGKNQDGKPYESYEDYVEDLADWKAQQRIVAAERKYQEQAQASAFSAKIQEAESRYENFHDVIEPAAGEIYENQKIAPAVKERLRRSDVLPDLLYTIASKPEELAHFQRMAETDVWKAIDYLVLTESLVREELQAQRSKGSEKVEATPAKPQTQAAKPAVEVGGRQSAPPDALLSAAQAGDFRTFKAELNRRSLARLKTG